MNLTGRNLYIADKKAQNVFEIEFRGTILEIKDETGILLNAGEIDLNKDLYACLYCVQLRTIVFVINKGTAYTTSLILDNKVEFEEIVEYLKQECSTEPSEQNAKINGYAKSVVDKLNEGVTIKILDTKEEEKIKCCPVCGMQCDPNIPYCMECGASV